jgi:hypothetical protein
MRPALFALRGFEAPVNQFADVALVLQDVEGLRQFGRRLARIERFVQLVLFASVHNARNDEKSGTRNIVANCRLCDVEKLTTIPPPRRIDNVVLRTS